MTPHRSSLTPRRRLPARVAFTWLALGATSLLAQSVAPAPAPTPPPDAKPELDPDATILLSPFTVSSERDDGYRAHSTLAGTRLNTPVKDLGSAISVYTQDFLNDIGATNTSELFAYATNMEAGGAQGNFSGMNAGILDREAMADGQRTNPQGSSRTRGLSAPEFTRSFYLSSIQIDSYNTTAITVNRGPNAVLFGIGSPAGVVDTALAQANLARNEHRFEFRYGDNDATRSVLDLNRALIPNKLSVRVIALDDQERYDQRPAFENKTRLYGAIAARPLRGTTLRASFETGKTRANRPITALPFNSINDFWWAEPASRRFHDWTFYDDPARNPSAAAQNANTAPANRSLTIGQAQIFGAIIIPYDNRVPGSGPGPSFRSTVPGTNLTGAGALTANAVRNQLVHPVANRDGAADTIQFNETFNLGETNLSGALFPGGIRPPGLVMQSFTNYDAFPFHKAMIDETSRQRDDFKTYNVTLEQLFWKDDRGVERLGFELGYNYEFYERFAANQAFAQANGNHIRIDPNITLPNGQPNPNVGRPYVALGAHASGNFYESERETRRGTAFFRHDFRDTFSSNLGRILGRHTVTGMYEQYRAKFISGGHTYRMFGQTAEAIGALPTNFNRLANAFVYLGDSVMNGAPLRLQPVRISPLTAGPTSDTTWFRADLGQTTQGNFVTTPSTVQTILGNTFANQNYVDSQAAVLQSYWLDDLVITTFGWRKDSDRSKLYPTRSWTTDPLKSVLTLDDIAWEGKPAITEEPEVLSSSVVVRWPQKLVRLPRGTDLSVFMSKSENSTPNNSRITMENVTLASPSGETDEYGFNLSLLNDKLSLRFARYETSQKNASRGGTYSSVDNAFRQLANFWMLQVNQTPEFDRINDANELLNTVPALRDLLQMRRNLLPNGQYEVVMNVLPAFSDTQDYVSKGTEIELTYNPTRNWRIAMNVAKQETVLSNLAPGARSIIEKLRPVWEKYKDTPRANVTDWQGPGVPYPVTSAEHLGTYINNNVMVPYNTLLGNEGVVSSEQRKWRVNLVTNYTFRTGFLKGFGVGSGVRWQDKYAIGYPVRYAADGRTILVDVANPYWSDDDLNVDAWVSYQRKIWNDRINWKVQLNGRNVIGDDAPIAIQSQPDGSVARTRLPPERRFYLTNTFSF